MAITNRLITRGMGVSRGAPGRVGLVTMGLGWNFVAIIIEAVVEVFRPRRRGGSSSSSSSSVNALQETTVWASLVELNQRQSSAKVAGSARVSDSHTSKKVIIEHVASQVLETMRVIAKRLR